MVKGKSENRGKAGSIALKLSAQNKVKENKKNLKLALNKFNEDRIPIIKTELAAYTGLSIATLNRTPYKEMIKEYQEEEKSVFSPKGKQEVASLIRENEILKEKIKILEEKYKRLKKEINYSKELF